MWQPRVHRMLQQVVHVVSITNETAYLMTGVQVSVLKAPKESACYSHELAPDPGANNDDSYLTGSLGNLSKHNSVCTAAAAATIMIIMSSWANIAMHKRKGF